MPIIKVWCLPQQTEEELNQLHKTIVREVCAVKELGFKDEKDMTVLFPQDLMKYGLGSDVIVEIFGLFEKPERTADAINKLATRVGGAVSSRFPHAKVECLVNQFNPTVGFWSSSQT